MSVKKIFGLIVLFVLVAVGLLWPLATSLSSSGATAAADPVSVSQYTGDFNVAADGNMSASETLNATFPSGRHGIFRFFDTADPNNPKIRRIPQISSITRDGTPEQYTTSWESNERYLVAKIGNPSAYVTPGKHTYVIAYTVPGVISPIDAGANKTFPSTAGENSSTAPQSTFFWNVVAPGWQLPMAAVTVNVTLPSPSQQVQCVAGTGTSGAVTQGPCNITGAGTSTLKLTSTNMPPLSGMTVRANMAPPPPPQSGAVMLPWSITWAPILGSSLPLLILVMVLTVAGAVVGFIWAAESKEEDPGFPVMYESPPGLGPAQTVYMTREEVGSKALSASLFYMADKKLVKLEPREDKSWLITSTGTAEQWAAIDPATRAVADELYISAGEGYWFLAEKNKKAGEALQSATGAIAPATKAWAEASGLVVNVASEVWGRRLWVLAFLLAIVGFFSTAIGFLPIHGPTIYGLPFAGFVIGGFGLMKTGVGTRRTTAGRELWSRSGGFERLLSTDSAEDRFDFAANKDLFISFIPFAVAFGVADKWAEKYRIYTHTEPPTPYWYPYGVGYGAWYASGGGFSDFDSTLSSSISTYQASQSSSSGGGGGMGGGGGGGGGGSW